MSSPGEFHPEALSEPYVNVSIHTAPIIQPEEDTKTPMRKHPWMVANYLPEPTSGAPDIRLFYIANDFVSTTGSSPFGLTQS